MAAVSLTPDDLAPFATIEATKAQAMIDDALARAARVAPCLSDDTLDDGLAAAAKAVLRDAVLRRNEQGTGALQSQTAGPFGQTLDTRQPRKVMFWPSEIEELESICAEHNGDDEPSGAFAIDSSPYTTRNGHADSCALNFGATYCSCGYVLTGNEYPLYGA